MKIALSAIAVIIVVLAAHAVQAQTIDRAEITIDIQPESSIDQKTVFFFSQPITDSILEYALNDAVRNIEVSDGTRALSYRLNKTLSTYNLEIFLEQPVDRIEIKYTADNVVFQSDSVKHLFTEFTFDSIVSSMIVQVNLPEGYGLYQNSFKPPGAQLGSDGKRIMLTWSIANTTGTLFSVKYASLAKGSEFVFLIIVLIAIIALLYYYFRKKTKEAFMHGFRTDEKKVIEYMGMNKKALQSDLQKLFGFSRAKATRIVSVLEGKGLVKKQRYGRTNKLYWVKGAKQEDDTQSNKSKVRGREVGRKNTG